MKNKLKCCGCTACQQICPRQCITMQPDEEGFLYPTLKEQDCIHCQKCEMVCPLYHKKYVEKNTTAYVGYATRNEIREQSSSGGVFSLLAEAILEQNGVVFGAAFDDKFQVHHISIESKEELKKLRGSKYVQSRLENTFFETKIFLENDRRVLFSGTACQIAGLKNYLGKEYDSLVTVDILCHGVPSTKVWEVYMKYQENKFASEIKSIYFRDKQYGWKNASLKIKFKNGKEYIMPTKNDIFQKLFLSDICLRESCYQCQFKEIPRVSDFTIGDCWGIENHMPEMDDDLGTSVILIHSNKGEKLLRAIENQMCLKEDELKNILPQSAHSRKAVRQHPNRKKYLEGLYRGEPIEELLSYTEKNIFQKVIAFMQYEMDVLKDKL